MGKYAKVTMEAQLGLIGGTMGLLTGFSILSGVEIIYYLLRFMVVTILSDPGLINYQLESSYKVPTQVLHVSQGPQSCGGLYFQQKI